MSLTRRYDIDWVRVIAIGLLLIYHVAIGFQSWGIMIGFITNDQSWESLWIPMSMLNIWRIPLLFFVSGMGVYFTLQNRDWKGLLKERAGRILLPFLFGCFAIVPVHIYLWQAYNDFGTTYKPGPGHLWFLGNIFAYVIMLSPVFFLLKKNEEGQIVQWLKRSLSTPLGLLPVFGALIAEVLILNPRPYELYAMTWHGFFLGLIAFFFGFCFVLGGRTFWKMILKWRWVFLVLAILLFANRAFYSQMQTLLYLMPVESVCWILSVFAFAYKYVNRPSGALTYLSQGAYPIYIIHMIFLYLGSMLIFPLNISSELKFVMALAFTGIVCFAMYDLIIKRVGILRLLFGLKQKKVE